MTLNRYAGTRVLADMNSRITLKRMAEDARERGDGPLGAILDVAVRTLDQRMREAEMGQAETGSPISTHLICRNVRVAGRRTSIKLEADFWQALDELAQDLGLGVEVVLEHVHAHYDGGNLTSAIRVFLLRHAAPGQTRGITGGLSQGQVASVARRPSLVSRRRGLEGE